MREVLREGVRYLEERGLDNARREAEWLLGRLAGVRPLELYIEEGVLPAQVLERFFSQVQARAAGAPLQYLLGEAEFFGARFAVQPGVFIPRPETEALVEAVLKRCPQPRSQSPERIRILDLGTGSGCIAITLARRLPACLIVGVELSWTALHVARRNALEHGVASRVLLVQGRWAEALAGRYDVIVSNPPYVPSAEVGRLPLDVRQEPPLSLDGGPDGLREPLEVLAQAGALLERGGLLAMECGEAQAQPLARAAARTAWARAVETIQDLAGRPRGVLITHG
ncbi:MAG: peptide chain release factor N(5)-glutamine methyltransferase [Candidatus Omnitrophica bacterium]|nr:peptide chain release factor N(5)-glutamine methyltransferase [Candidatus Omnitrophota bacterium]